MELTKTEIYWTMAAVTPFMQEQIKFMRDL